MKKQCGNKYLTLSFSAINGSVATLGNCTIPIEEGMALLKQFVELGESRDICESRMCCNIFRAIKFGYVKSLIKYCNTWGWKYFWYDTFRLGEIG